MEKPDTGTLMIESKLADVLMLGEMVTVVGHEASDLPLLPKMVAFVASVEMVVKAAAVERAAAPRVTAAPTAAAVATADRRVVATAVGRQPQAVRT